MRPMPLQAAGLLTRDAGLSVFVSLLLPYLLFEAHLGALNRVLYPLTSLALGGYFLWKRSPWFLGLTVWLFCACSLVRRMTDLQVGWDPANPILLAPYLVAMLAALSLLPYASRPEARYASSLLMVLACVAYGVLIAIIEGRLVSGFVDWLRWSVGPFCALYALRNGESRAALRRTFVCSLLFAGPVMAVYGILQFVDPAEWDRDWMTNITAIGFDSIGNPAPFEVRVFGPLNAPASLAMLLLVSCLAYMGRPLLQMLLPMLVMLTCLALTQYRAGWGGLAVGMGTLLLAGGTRERIRVTGAIAAAVMASGLLALVPQIATTVTDRFDTLSRLSTDVSGEARVGDYRSFLTNLDSPLLGEGLAIAGSVRRLDGSAAKVIDGGLMEPLMAFGVFGATAFMGGIAALCWALWRPSGASSSELPLYRAIVAGTFVQLVFGRVLMGEAGICAWIALGLGLSVLAEQRSTHGISLGIAARGATTGVRIDAG